jgi:cell division protein FtsB
MNATTVPEPPSDEPSFRKVIDSTTMLTLARFFMPVVLAVIGYFMVTTINDLKAGQRDGLSQLKEGQTQVWVQISKIADAQATTNTVQSALSSKVDGAVKQLDHLQVQVDNLPKR